MTRRWLALGTASFSISVVGLGACVGDDPGPGAADGTSSSSGGAEAGSPPPIGGGGDCTEPVSCVNGKLVACDVTVVDCGAVGCVAASATRTTRCKLFTPTAPAKTSDLTNEIVTASLEIGASTTLDVTTGAITNGQVAVRGPTNGAVWNEDKGIGFELREIAAGRKAAVFVAKDIVLTGTPTFAGSVSQSQAFVLVAQRSVRVLGNVTFPCGRITGGEPGGGDAVGPSGGHVGGSTTLSVPFTAGSGGGGGNVAGGAGGTVQGTQQPSGQSGMVPVEVPGGAGGSRSGGVLMGGGGGGGAYTVGGEGGAAVLVVAGTVIEVGGTSPAGLDVSGCGGAATAGGGAGGWLGLEAPVIRGFGNAGLAGNGGSGGGAEVGGRGNFSTAPALGGQPNESVGMGGNGGTDVPPAAGGSFHDVTVARVGGGGGGAGGWVILRTASGALDLAADAAAGSVPWFVSPSPTLLGLTAEGS